MVRPRRATLAPTTDAGEGRVLSRWATFVVLSHHETVTGQECDQLVSYMQQQHVQPLHMRGSPTLTHLSTS